MVEIIPVFASRRKTGGGGALRGDGAVGDEEREVNACREQGFITEAYIYSLYIYIASVRCRHVL